MPRKSVIPQGDLERVAHALAAGLGQKQLTAELGWDARQMQRCIARLNAEVWAAHVHCWSTSRGNALEWLRISGLSTPEELAAVVAMTREKAREDRQETLRIGALLQGRGDLDDAERIFRRHLRDDPEDADVEIELGSCLLDAGRLDEALELFERALSAEPEHERGRLCNALALDRAGRFPEAMAELERAQRLSPGDLYVQALLGDWCMRAPGDHAPIVAMLRGLMTTLVNWYAGKPEAVDHCRDVAKVVFLSLWERSYHDAAAEVARVARRHGWSTAGIEDRLEHSEVRRTRAPRPFLAVVQAHAPDPPARWPEGATGFLVRLHVVARDAGEAMAVALHHLRRGEPGAVQFQLDVMPAPGQPVTSADPRVCEAGERVWIRVIREVPVVAAPTAPADPPRDQRLRHQSEARRRTHSPVRRRSPR
ncbi:MAG TPA: tetratricopeptide repeat protein [Acidimicrobiales bacterium]|nr:tetratricopeptide repeat protein [Acidimicrobiales bacterium]